MPRELITAIEIADSRLAQQVANIIDSLPDIHGVQWIAGLAEKNHTEPKIIPDILIIDEHPQADNLFDRLRVIFLHFPQTAVFVLSEEKRPQHIVEIMKAGAAEYFVTPLDEEALKAAVNALNSKLAIQNKDTKGFAYSFISSKGGWGATVVAANLATAMARDKDTSVGLCDMSFQAGDSSVLLDILPRTTIMDICRNYHRLDTAFLRGVMTPTSVGLDFLAAPPNPEESAEILPEHVAKILKLGKKIYDQLVVDCTSMSVGPCTCEAFRESEKVFVVTDLSVPAVRNAARLCQLIQKLGIPAQKVEIVVNRYIKGSAISLDEVEKTLHKKIFWLFPNDFDEIISSINRGIPLVKLRPSSPFSRNILEFAQKLNNPQSSENYRGIRGAFGKAI